jgi:hypothetical protein
MRWLAVALLALVLSGVAFGSVSRSHIPYPPHPEGSVLTGDGVKDAQFIIMVNKSTKPSVEPHQLLIAAAVRNELIALFDLHTRPGHTPMKGYRLTCLSRARIRGATIWLAAWEARTSAFDSIKAYAAMTRSSLWHGGCASPVWARPVP